MRDSGARLQDSQVINVDPQPNFDVDPMIEVPKDWRSWAAIDSSSSLSPEGFRVVQWATDVVTEFYGDEWFARNVESHTNPLFSLYDYPLSNPIAATSHIERAARIALLAPTIRAQLAEGPNGIRASNSPEEFDHLDLVLETLGLARKDGWVLAVEISSNAGRYPDVHLVRDGIAHTIEVTQQGTDRKFRAIDTQAGCLRDAQWRIEATYEVECKTRVSRVLSDEEFGTYIVALNDLASKVTRSGEAEGADIGFAAATIFPKGKRPDGAIFEGPALTDNLWPRVGVRLREKAKQTVASGRTWIRFEELGGLMMITAAYHLSPLERLHALLRNISVELKSYSHVQGVVVSHGAAPDWTPFQRESTFGDEASGSVVLERRLPGGRRRTTYVLHLHPRGIMLPGSLVLDPARWYASESSWLDWGLRELGMPPLQRLIELEGYRRLLP